jgi:hypothetical protein
MVPNVGPFIKTWYVGMTGNPSGFLQPGYQLLLGTGKHGAKKPFLNDEYEVAVGFAVLDAKGKPVLTGKNSPNQPLIMLFVNGTLRYVGSYKDSLLRIYISMAEAHLSNGDTTYPAIYGTTTSGDPDQVGVWGAEGSPPPSPDPE